MPIDKNLIKQKLLDLEDMVSRIKNMDIVEGNFVEDVDIQDLLTFRLQQAVEICIDIASHLISARGLTKPDNARSSFEILSNQKIIDENLAKRLALAVSFRNIAVHGYNKLNFEDLFHDYKKDLIDLEDYLKQISKYISSVV